MLHVERERNINNNPYYDTVTRFEDYIEAFTYFKSIVPKEGERWWFEYSSEYDARILAVKGYKLRYVD